MSEDALIEIEHVSVTFDGRTRVLDDVSLAIRKHEIVGLVGESGCGKTTLCRVIAGLTTPVSGTVRIGGRAVDRELGQHRLAFRRRVQMLQQDAVSSLSPRMTIGRALEEPIAIHRLPRAEAKAHLAAIAGRLGLRPDLMRQYPHEISGGQARRAGIARALVLRPEILVADEPTAGLDATMRGDLLELLLELQRELGLTCLLVSHDLNAVRRIAQRIVVMYLGQVIEDGPTRDVFRRPSHPYTTVLLSTNPVLDPRRRYDPIVLEGEVPSAADPPSGCRFHTRCPVAQPRCAIDPPPLGTVPALSAISARSGTSAASAASAASAMDAVATAEPRRLVRCHFPFSLKLPDADRRTADHAPARRDPGSSALSSSADSPS